MILTLAPAAAGAALQPRIFRTFREFSDRYCIPHPARPSSAGAPHSPHRQRLQCPLPWSPQNPQRFGGFANGCNHSEELHSVLHTAVMVRRMKAAVLTQLPAKMRTRVFVAPEHSAETRRLAAALKEARAPGPGGGPSGGGPPRDGPSSNQLLSAFYTASAEAKTGAVRDHIREARGNVSPPFRATCCSRGQAMPPRGRA